ncbi:helix-turn-helix domain-containing protein [Luteolibacter sp. GHJ8]|uniref:Helix-turn-helix domain-containing protein n=1 Tax=Luteolibacter rhizosphaerae TaxID=2989719 RepID=A0ABT3FZI5_9BACT|nr:helix-turn-helix transcriptional regulator [Luteolibacter rhizosphaerae]MCW1913003.1 helix-turn-helix domain-containing protein [Luteolibacter rhizosphaerae]
MKAEPVEFGKKLGGVFLAERERKKLSKTRLSEMAGVARAGIVLFERGDRMPSIHICKALADALGVPLSRLVKRAEKLMEELE